MNLVFLQAKDTEQAVSIVFQTMNDLYVGLMERLPYLIIGVVVVAAFAAFGRVLSRIVVTAGERTRLDLTLAYLLGRIVSTGLAVFGLLVAAVVIFPSFRPGDLVAGLGITSVAVGFAFKDVLQNFFAGILLLWRRPFVVGDDILVGSFEGRVEEITVRSTRIRTYSGERVIIPNGDVYTSSVVVRTAYPARRLKFVVGIGYLDDIDKGRQAILDAVRSAEGVLKDPPPAVYVTELASSSVNFRVNFWIDARTGDSLLVTDRVATAVKRGLDNEGIDIPYPHSVVLFHDETDPRQDGTSGKNNVSGRSDGIAASQPHI